MQIAVLGIVRCDVEPLRHEYVTVAELVNGILNTINMHFVLNQRDLPSRKNVHVDVYLERQLM